uniref:Uncharacterized conserved protein, DUF302 family n=1 Tax=Candidatus Kentrum sp. MB TaxID=2138164 RepID=A0A450XYP0_9GAMM|nr:MAG: Uncharacterized conserved protein, DUF302 family [Candidatus Kentron sp. MB]VFK34409.1 MAG: Uncharacterized conserved protein, DUF302 family [Candidatus Kentron sp. MB]VFK76710.1 MAG: Uncharacterized conserved protein, DUF302 family [Candidatus Kentron sp. MB]
MGLIRNILVLVGLLTLLGIGYTVYTAWPIIAELRPALVKFYLAERDPQFTRVYLDFAKKVLEHQDPGMAITWSVPVKEGIGVEEVKDSLKSIATEHNFLFVGESPFYKQVESITEAPYRHISFLSFCNARIGKMMADYRDAYTGLMPCRIAVVEDKKGKLWLHSMNLDLMIHGGKKLPEDVKKNAIRARDAIRAMIEGAANGDF